MANEFFDGKEENLRVAKRRESKCDSVKCSDPVENVPNNRHNVHHVHFVPYRDRDQQTPLASFGATAILAKRLVTGLFISNSKVLLRWLGAILLMLGVETGWSDPSAATSQSLVVLGDSLAAGYGVDPSEAWPAKLQEKIRDAGLPYTVINAGVSGDTTSGGLRRLDWILRRPVGVLLLELGGNDGLRGIPLSTTESNLVSIIEKTKGKWPSAQVVIAGMQIPGNMGEDYTKKFSSLFPQLAKRYRAPLIPFLLEGVGGRPELNQADQIHPNPTGHALVASNVWSFLKPLLIKPPSSPAVPQATD